MSTERELRIQAINEEAFELARALEPLDLEPAADYLRKHEPHWEVVATLPFLYATLARHAAIRQALSNPRQSADAMLRVTIEATGCRNYAELHASENELARALVDRYPKEQVQNAFTRLRKKLRALL